MDPIPSIKSSTKPEPLPYIEMNQVQVALVTEKQPQITLNGFVIQKANPPLEEVKPIYKEVINSVISGYCPCKRCCGPNAKGLTRLETSAWSKGVAADWKHYPPGTVLYIEGYGKVTVDDTGSKIKGKGRFDVRFTYHWQARQWGMKNIEVIVISRPY